MSVPEVILFTTSQDDPWSNTHKDFENAQMTLP